ncbi:DNA polymerase clamp loader subunit [Vibrio phage phi-ST2]|nr:DNA polymerase clamp loader subunit [Vibrio phage phi-ST2]URQ03663.1 DNA polymerase clamp loader subunit [Vibrio phage PVA23]
MDIFEFLAKGEETEARIAEEEKEYEEELKKAKKAEKYSPFDFVDSIYMKKRLPDAVVDEQYLPFMVNRALSNGIDTVLHAYIMDSVGSKLPNEMQYDYLYHAVRKGKRFNSWAKEPKYDYVDLIVEVYNVNKSHAISISNRLTPEELNQLQEWYDSRTGGLTR